MSLGVSPPKWIYRFFFFFLGGAVMVSVYVADVPVMAAVPGEVAVTEHWPADSAVRTFRLITQGPVSLSRTVAPEAAVAVRLVLVPA